jgi:hypothetical protein
VAKPGWPPRRIEVRPDQVFQPDRSRLGRRSFEGVVVRYVLASAAVVIAVSVFAMIATALIGR